ncbi:MAG TPA: sulfatase-like hydrolase/transferase [Humisphaera sp.]
MPQRSSPPARASRPFTVVLVAAALALLFGGFASAAAAAAPASQPAGGAKPNFLILVADDLGYADVGFTGGTAIPTPNLDRFAAGGVTFTDFRACPMCSPTRAGLMTGRWPGRFGMMRAVVPPWSDAGLPPDERTLPELLAAAGYERRGIFGKWHLGHARRAFLPLAHGFTEFVGCYNGAIDYLTHERDGEVDWHHNDRTVREDGYATDLIATHAIMFIKDAPAGAPWLAYVPFTAPHAPFQGKEEDRARFPQLKNPDRRNYAAMVVALDRAVGQVLAAADARPDAANTLVLFMSDNGGIPRVGSNAPYRGGKLGVYEGGTRVCAAARWPAGGLVGGKRFDGRVGYIDVLPTVLAAVGAKPAAGVDGLDFLPAVRGTAALPERPWFSYIHQDAGAHASVHLGRWKLVAHGDAFAEKPATAPTLELYDLSADPTEATDVAAKHADVVARLHGLLREFGALQRPGVKAYGEGREGFTPPKDWIITKP